MKAFLATIVLFSCFNSGAQIKLPVKPEWVSVSWGTCSICPLENLQGKIRYIANLSHVRTDSTGKQVVQDSGYYGSGYWYDEHNNILIKTLFIQGEEKIYLLNSYDDKLRLIRSVDVKFGKTEDSIIYNEAENTITRYQNKDRQPNLVIYFFDKTGNLVKLVEQYPWYGGITYEYIYEYDNKKRLTREIHRRNTFGNNTTAYPVRNDTITYEYFDKEDIKILKKYEQINGQKSIKEESIVYVKEQTKVLRKYDDPDDVDTDSLVVSDTGSVLYWLDGYEKVVEGITYFDKCNRILAFPLDRIIYQYKLDSKGNWVEKRAFEKGELVYVWKRIIEYFE